MARFEHFKAKHISDATDSSTEAKTTTNESIMATFALETLDLRYVKKQRNGPIVKDASKPSDPNAGTL